MVAADSDDERLELVQKAGWTLVWVSISTVGILSWSGWSDFPAASLWSPLFVLVGIVGAILIWTIRRPLSSLLQVAGLVAGLLAVGISEGWTIHARRFFTTDAAAFNQLATRLMLEGKNPYTSSMHDVLLRPAINYWTYTVDGGHVHQFSYPAGAFLFQVPFMWLGWHHELTEWINLFAWLVIGVIFFVVFPKTLRWLAVLLMTTGIFIGLFAGGGTDALFLLFFVIAAWKWDAFGTGRTAGLANWIGPVALGIACSIKQTPWFAVPFFALGIYLEARRRGNDPLRRAAAYAAIVLGVFFVINVPFIIWNASAWWNGTLLPFAKPLVADGQGLVTLALHGYASGVVLWMLSLAGVLAYVALLVSFGVWFSRLKRAWLFMLPLVLFIPARSFSGYLVGFVPVAFVAALTVANAPPVHHPVHEVPHRGLRWLPHASVAALVLAAAIVCGVAFTSAPLQVRIVGFTTHSNATQLTSVTVTITNTSTSTLTPRFMVDLTGQHPNGFWSRLDGRAAQPIAPGQTQVVTLVPPVFEWAPSYGQWWLVDAYTTSPAALSTSPPVKWKLGRDQS